MPPGPWSWTWTRRALAGVARALWTSAGLAPGFAVVAQGLVPGKQSIHRAEVCAVVQALRLLGDFPGYRGFVGVDSSSALAAVLGVLQGSSLARVKHRDLLQLISPCPLQPVLHKVAAHKNLDEVPEHQIRTTIGNACADEAARKAREADLTCVHESVLAVRQWMDIQELHLAQWFTYLIQLARCVAPRKQALQRTEALSSVVEYSHRAAAWLGLAVVGCPVPGLPSAPEQVLVQLVWPPWFTTRLWGWASRLGWPLQPTVSRGDRTCGITYLELFVNFVATMCILPPKLCGRAGRGRYVDLLQQEGRLYPFALKEVLLTFVAALKTLTSTTGCTLLHSPAHHRILCLSMLPGESNGRKGLLHRPQMENLQITWELLAAYFDSRSLEGLRQHCLRSRPPSATCPVLTARWQQAETSRLRRAQGRST